MSLEYFKLHTSDGIRTIIYIIALYVVRYLTAISVCIQDDWNIMLQNYN